MEDHLYEQMIKKYDVNDLVPGVQEHEAHIITNDLLTICHNTYLMHDLHPPQAE